jgi:hypothetical protein
MKKKKSSLLNRPLSPWQNPNYVFTSTIRDPPNHFIVRHGLSGVRVVGLYAVAQQQIRFFNLLDLDRVQEIILQRDYLYHYGHEAVI